LFLKVEFDERRYARQCLLAEPGYLRTNKHRRLAATMHRSTMPRQCGDAVLRMVVKGGPPNLGGGGIP